MSDPLSAIGGSANAGRPVNPTGSKQNLSDRQLPDANGQKLDNTTQSNSVPKPQSKLSENQINVLNNIRKYLVTPFAFGTTALGLLSFALSNIFKNQNEFVDKIANYVSKGAVYATSLFMSINRAWSKDTFGTLAFSSDFVTAALASEDDLYQWKGFGSGLDHSPLILGELAHNSNFLKQYGYKNGEFSNYKGFPDSAKKMLQGFQFVFSDIFREFKENSLGKAFMNCFVSGKTNAEKNLLVSEVGIIVGAFMGTILGFKKSGATLRDGFGVYADLAYIAKGLSNVSGQKQKESKKYYTKSGVEYTIGSMLDLIYRWTGMNGLNYLALGIDRLGARDAALGIVAEATEPQDTVSDTKKAETVARTLTAPTGRVSLQGI